MKRLRLHLGGSLHGKRLEIPGEPDRYVFEHKQPKPRFSKVNGCNAFTPVPPPEREPYLRVWVEPLEIAVYVREGYEPTGEDEVLVGVPS